MQIEKCHRCVGNQACENQVATECLPVPFFGDITEPNLKVVTVGLNPALNEFFINGVAKKRTHRLALLTDYEAKTRENLLEPDVVDAKTRREAYFRDVNRDWHPYFEKMESVINRVNSNWTYMTGSAVHVDVVACATQKRWSELTSVIQTVLIENCREHFTRAICSLPDATVILCDGPRALKEMGKLGLRLEMQAGQLINVREESGGDHGMLGELFTENKKFLVRGWSSQVSRLSAVWRFDLAHWLRGTLPTDT